MYTSHGVTVRDEVRYNHCARCKSRARIEHDLLDAQVVETRVAILAEIDAEIAVAAPGAARVDFLAEARRAVLTHLESRAESAARESAEREARHAEASERLRASLEARDDKMSFGDIDHLTPAERESLDGLKRALESERQEKQRREDEERKECEKREQNEEREEREVRNAWIAKFGSARLKSMLAEGIDIERTYRDERLALDRPGWGWLSCVCGDIKDVHDTSVLDKHLAALASARAAGVSDARLAWLRVSSNDHELDENNECERCGECESDEDDSRVVLVAEFLAHDIMLEVS